MHNNNKEAIQLAPPILKVIDLHKSFGSVQILKGINLNLYPGEILGFLGGSGTGKSVLLRCIIGLESIDSGEIWYKQLPIHTFQENDFLQVRKNVAYVFQNGALFDSISVEENIAYPLKEHSKLSQEEISSRVTETLKMIGLEHARDLLPSSLSGGMQKRVGVARAVIQHPDIILYDEPTAGLDPFNTNRLLELMKIIQKKGHSAIFVTHDLPAAFKVCQRIALLYQGKIYAVDSVENMKLSTDPIIKAFLAGEAPA